MKWMWTFAVCGLIVGVGVSHAPRALAMPECTPEVLEDGSLIHGQVYDAKPIRKKPAHVKALLPKRTMGAKLYLRAEKGMTRGYLQRAAECHARTTTLPSHQNDPLRVEDIDSIRVYGSGGSFVVAVTGDHAAAGREIWERAKALAAEDDTGTAETRTGRASGGL